MIAGFPQSRRELLPLALLFALFAAVTLGWLSLDKLPPNWDDGWYLTNSLVLLDALHYDGIAGWSAKFMHVMGFKAPLITALPTPFYLIFGRRWHAAFLVNIAAMLVMMVCVGRLAWRWSSTRAAWIAICAAGTMPLLYGLARWYMVEYCLAATVALAMLLLVESDWFERRGAAAGFGLVCGLGLLLKFSFILFAGPAFVYVLLRARRRARALLLAGIPCAALALPWYIVHFRATWENALSAGFGQSAVIQGTGPILSFNTIGRYLANVARSGTSEYFALMLAASCGLFIWGKVKMPPVLVCWLLPFLFFLFGGNKDVRYIAPILPAAALALALSLDLLVPRTVRGGAILALALSFPLLQMFAVSFGVPWRAANSAYARRYTTAVWPLDEILITAAAHSTFKTGNKNVLLVGSDVAGLNANNIELVAVARQLPFAIETTAHENDLSVLLDRLDRAAIFVFKEGGAAESPLMNRHIRALTERVRLDKRFTEIPFARPLPDGGVARLFHKAGSYSRLSAGIHIKGHLDMSPEFSVAFGGVIELTAFSATASSGSLVLNYRWHALGRPVRDYWCFTHVLDADGRVIGNLDHPLLDGKPPATLWGPGDSALEEMRFVLPPGVDAAKLRIKVGIYDPPSGERLRTRSQGFREADDGTAIIFDAPRLPR